MMPAPPSCWTALLPWRHLALVLSCLLLSPSTASVLGDSGHAAEDAGADSRPRIRDLGVEPGILPPGPLNAITDVAGVRVGHVTLVEGTSVRTGVTAILPHGGDLFRDKVPAAVWTANGFGKAAGFLQVRELGTLETPVVLTNTLAVGTAVRAVVDWTLARPGNEGVYSVNAVVGETNDGYLNDIRAPTVKPEHVHRALDNALASPAGAPVAEGSVGAGTGTRALGWKGGIGTASRQLPEELGGYTVGALVQTNFGGILRIDGAPVGEALGRHAYREVLAGQAAQTPETETPETSEAQVGKEVQEDEEGSCMIVLATDAPVSPRNLERMARRAVLALGRVGSFISNGSGDFILAFSTANRRPYEPEAGALQLEELPNRAMSPLFLAVVEATEEAIYNSLLQATTITGHQGRTVEAIPVEAVLEVVGASPTRSSPTR